MKSKFSGPKKKSSAHDSYLVFINLSEKRSERRQKIELGFNNPVKSDDIETLTFYFDKSIKKKFMMTALRAKQVATVVEKVNEIVKNERNVQAPKPSREAILEIDPCSEFGFEDIRPGIIFLKTNYS